MNKIKWLVIFLLFVFATPRSNAGDIILENTTDKTIVVRVFAWADWFGPKALFAKAVAEIKPGGMFEATGSGLHDATFIEWKEIGAKDWQPSWAYREDEIKVVCHWTPTTKTCFPSWGVEAHQSE